MAVLGPGTENDALDPDAADYEYWRDRDDWRDPESCGDTMSQQVRFAPDALDIVYVREGYVTVQRAAVRTSHSETLVAPGHHPAWYDRGQVAYCPPEDGVVHVHDLVTEQTWVLSVQAGNTLTAHAGRVAVHRTDPVRVIASWSARPLAGATDPVLSADASWLAMLVPDVPPGAQSLAVVNVVTGQTRSIGGSFLRPRFSHTGTTLTWEEVGGQIYGIRDVANPTSPVVRLSRPDDSLSHPVGLWMPAAGLFVFAVQATTGDAGILTLAEWESCVAQAPMGYQGATSGGSGYDHDIAGEGDAVALMAYLLPDGTLGRGSQSLLGARLALPLPGQPPIEPPVPPIEPPIEPPEPPIDPPVPPQEPDMTAADIRRYMGDLTNDLLFGAIKRFHDEVLSRDRPLEPLIKSGAWTEGDLDFNTNDVVTGGANGFFVRSYVSEFIIARDAGRPAPQASGDGYDKAIAAYMNAVNPPPAPEPGALRGPIGVADRHFTVPD